MNELLTLVHDFNQNHKADAFFSYAGHVDWVQVSVNEADTIYKDGYDQKVIFTGYSYINTDYGQYPTIDALTEAFKTFAEGYEE